MKVTSIGAAAALAAVLAINVGGDRVVAQSSSSSAATQEAATQLEPFEVLIGGRWVMDETFHHTYEWGVGRLSVKARSFAVSEDGAQLVSEATWFWHPGQQTIKGYATAVGMPVSMFDYSTRFEPGRLVSDLTAYAPTGVGQDYLETFEFTEEDTYVWTLLLKRGDSLEESMGATFKRVR